MKKALKKIWAWISGPKSDFALFAVALVLLNLVGYRAFFRVDLTPQRSYSLSPASHEAIRALEEPLSVKVFFTKNLPAPYNSVERYLRDLLAEYGSAAGKRLTCEFFDVQKPENQELARSYGIGVSRVQELKDNEVGVKNAYMGIVLVYADAIETLDGLASTEGLEYRITTTIGKMVSRTSVLSGLTGKVTMTLYTSDELSKFGIAGYKDLERNVRAVYDRVNKKNRDRIEFASAVPRSKAEVEEIVAKYGLHRIGWSDRKDGTESGVATLGIVLQYGDRFRAVPFDLARDLFGGYAIAGLDGLEQGVSDALQGLVSQSPVIGYVTGHGEMALEDERNGSARFAENLSDMYELKPVNLSGADIPSGMDTIVIDGPKAAFSEAELYRVDQFIMRGGNVIAFLDPYDVIQPQGEMAYYGGQPTYRPIQSGLERLLSKYGAAPEPGYVLDKNCYIARQQGQDDVPIYYAPLLAKESLNAKSPISRGLAYVIFLQSGGFAFDEKNVPSGRKIRALADSSPESWVMKDNVSLMPYGMSPPAPDAMGKRHLAVLLEGNFESAFDRAPEAESDAKDGLVSERHMPKSVRAGKIIAIGTSAVTGSAVMDRDGREPISIFVRNAVDYAAGKEDLIAMRTKGLSLNTLSKTTATARSVARGVNLYGLPLLAAVAGLVAWRIRARRRKSIRERYMTAEAAKREADK
ncbi:MAG TPA: Gldg family protein [Treponemataceae bacterium]|nr:Gldg family protein [Treponemataceae bacterium]